MASSTPQIKPYIAIPEEIKVPLDQMDQVIETFPDKYAVVWIAGKFYQSTNHETRTEPVKRRRITQHSWYKTFFCHRGGEKEITGPRKTITSKKRPRQKASKKIGCPAGMRITCYKKDPENVVFTFKNQHNHAVGTKEDFCLLPVSKATKEFIRQKLREGHDCKEVQRQLNSYVRNNITVENSDEHSQQEVFHRDQISDPNLVYNQYKKMKEAALL